MKLIVFVILATSALSVVAKESEEEKKAEQSEIGAVKKGEKQTDEIKEDEKKEEDQNEENLEKPDSGGDGEKLGSKEFDEKIVEKVPDHPVGDGMHYPEKNLGPNTTGTCHSLDFGPGPFENFDTSLLKCFDFRNAVCKDGKCRCMKGQKLSDDESFCRESNMCTAHTGGTCSWLGCASARNSKCVDGVCVCDQSTKSDKPCSSMHKREFTMGEVFQGYGPYYYTCQKRNEFPTCLKYTLGTCLISTGLHILADKIPIVGGKIVDLAIGDDGTCWSWRNAVCTEPVVPSGSQALDVVNGLYSKVKGKGGICGCRTSDCAVWDKKNGGFKCVFSRLLTLNDTIEDFQVLQGQAYTEISQSLGGSGHADDGPEFFDIRYDLLKKYPEHATCVRGMKGGSVLADLDSRCKAFLCEFAREASGPLPHTNHLCGFAKTGGPEERLGAALPAMAVAVALALVAFGAMRLSRHGNRKERASVVLLATEEQELSAIE